MKKKVAIIDYGLGNLFSINQACLHVGLDSFITSDKNDIANAAALILPGVGAFGDAIQYLHQAALTESILGFVKTGKPFMGICLGMQLLFTQSEEFGNHKGLDLIKGNILKFPSSDFTGKKITVPQIQWNTVSKRSKESWENSPMKNIPDNTFMHFVHSFYAVPDHETDILNFTEYAGITYASAVMKNNITGFQYHPEKSGKYGLKIYQNWSDKI